MCGFAGVIAWDDRCRVSREMLAAMSARIAHRGPDGEGSWINHDGEVSAAKPQAALAHRRLAIIDPDSRANQPFSDSRDRQLVFNGEIYNFRELCAELTALRPDYAWRTNCDTEVLLVAYDVWGEACCEKFDGMFAFAIWDAPAGAVFFARDRMGQKPLYLAIAPSDAGHRVGAIAFASELPALRALPWVDTATDLTSLGHYLRWGYIPAPLTIYRGCEKLPPARWMRATSREVTIEQYFDSNRSQRQREDASVGRVRQLVFDAVRRQLVSDVPLGCFLSGGIDSSIIAAAMKAAVGRDQSVMTFSIGFDDPRYDETQYAAEIARHLGTKHQQFTVRPDAAHDLQELAAVFGEPFGDSSALPTHYLARETRNHVKVALSGDGGDELFGGYDRYRAMWMAEAFRAMPAALQRVATNKIWEHLPGKHPKSAGTRVKRLLASLSLAAPQRYDSYMRYFDEPQIRQLFPREDARDPAKWLVHEYEALADGRDVVQTAMALDRVTYLPDDLLAKVDRASMLHALEVRSPFMDPALVTFAAGLSGEQLFGLKSNARAFTLNPMNAPAKLMLRDAFAADLPESVFKRPKMGFAVPVGEWLRNDLAPLLRDSLTAQDSFAAAHFHTPTLRRLIDEHAASKADHSQRLYALLMLELWWRESR
jgi:asparagine synthase (glutamine-hydrolysing)